MRLSRAEQLRLAEYLKYQGRQGMLPVEQFMRDYFHHTAHVWQMAHRLSELMQPASRVSRVLEPMLGRRTEDDYQIGRHEVSATPRATARLAQHPEEVLKLVDLARHEGKRISQDTWHFVYRTAPQYSNEPKPALVSSVSCRSSTNPLRLGELLRRLHEMGVLEKIIPEFTHARSLLQFNQYHKYTVDEHCIRAVEEATQLCRARGRGRRRLSQPAGQDDRCTWRCCCTTWARDSRRITARSAAGSPRARPSGSGCPASRRRRWSSWCTSICGCRTWR